MTIEITGKARKELNQIQLYISSESGLTETAAKIVSEIIAKIDDLKIFPNRHKHWRDSDYRFFSVKGYLVFYRYDEPAERIIVERVIHSRRNIDKLI